jgi:hypothetical protein
MRIARTLSYPSGIVGDFLHYLGATPSFFCAKGSDSNSGAGRYVGELVEDAEGRR